MRKFTPQELAKIAELLAWSASLDEELSTLEEFGAKRMVVCPEPDLAEAV